MIIIIVAAVETSNLTSNLKLIISTAFDIKASFSGIASSPTSSGHQFVNHRYTWMEYILILKAVGGLGPFKYVCYS
jgi:hypothetical protein